MKCSELPKRESKLAIQLEIENMPGSYPYIWFVSRCINTLTVNNDTLVSSR